MTTMFVVLGWQGQQFRLIMKAPSLPTKVPIPAPLACSPCETAARCSLLLACVCAALSLQGTLLAQFKQEAKARMSVLQKLNHINAEGTVLLKGRAACEIDTTDELLSTGVCTAGW